MKKYKKPTPGELLARIISGDKQTTDEDFEKATVEYFAERGVHCEFKKNKSRKDIDSLERK